MGGVRQEKEAAAPPTALVPAVVVKGKRSKRQRVHAPPLVLTAAAAEWSSSAASATAASAEEDSGTSTPSADDAASTNGCVTEEEEDMALCLVLLSRGEPAVAKEKVRKEGGEVAVVKEARFRSRRPADGAGAGEFVYECKTCNKCFPSFQALGGHRTSHKKPRLLPPVPPSSSDDKNSPAAVETTTTTTAPSHPPSPPPAAQETPDATTALLGNLPAVPAAPLPKQEPGATVSATASSSSRHPRVHECSICGAEFASGQALGGHMRRHRPLVPAAARVGEAPRKERSLLELDLNMPAPCDEAETSVTSPRFVFPVDAKRQQAPPPLFPATAASALVGCHY